MLKALLTRLFNHLINQNPWAKAQLLPFSGKAVCFSMPPVSATLVVLEDGGLAMAGETCVAEATVTIPLSAALRVLANENEANSLIHIEGDTELASVISKVIRGISWNYEEDISQIIGGKLATKVSDLGQRTAEVLDTQVKFASQTITEYLREDQDMVAPSYVIKAFIADVDQLRDNTECLAKRLGKFEAEVTDTLNQKNSS